MARELTVVVRVESDEAKRKLAAIDAQADQVSSGFKRMGAGTATATSHLEKLDTATAKTNLSFKEQVKQLVLADAAQMRGVAATTAATTATTAHTAATTAQATSVMATTRTLGAATLEMYGLTASVTTLAGAINAMLPALLVFTATYTAVRALGSVYSDWREKQDQAALAAETLAAKQDVINKAIELGASRTIDYAKAVDFLTEAEARRRAQLPEEAAQRFLDDLTRRARAGIDAAAAQAALTEGLARRGIVQGDVTNFEQQVQRPYEQAQRKMEEASRRTREELDRLKRGFDLVGPSIDSTTDDFVRNQHALDRLNQGYDLVGPSLEDTTEEFLRMREAIDRLNAGYDLVGPSIEETTDDFVRQREELDRLNKGFDLVGPELPERKNLFKDALKSLTDIRGIGKGILQGIFNDIGAGISGLINKGIGALAGLVGRGFGKLFGIDKEHERVNDLRDAYQALTFGSLEEMARAFQRVGLTVDRVLNAKKVKDFDAAVEEFNRKLKFQEQTWADAQAAAEKYGLTLEELGPAWQRQALDKQAQDLFRDFQLLTGAGADQVAVLTKMSGAINDYVKRAITLGVEVPSAMRPILERMAELGLLTDASGKKVGSLEEAGITFSETMTEGFKRVTDAIMEMVDALRLYLGLAPRAQAPPAGAPPEPPPLPEIPHMHRGGVVRPFRLRTDEVPIVAQTGEGILSRTGMRTLGTQGLLGINRGLLPMPPGRSAWTPGGVDIGARHDGMRGGWMKRTPQHPWISIDARGAVMGSQAPAELARMVANHLAKGGQDRTRMRGVLQVG